MLEKLIDGIYRVCIPFENIYTTSFLLTEGEKSIILDCGTTKEDVEKFIVPAAAELGISPDYIVLSHTHGDHAGGLEFLRAEYPDAAVGSFSQNVENAHCFDDGEVLFERFQMLNLKGHSKDCLALYDLKSSTLLTGDCLQLFGVGNYGTAVTNLKEYLKSIERIRKMQIDAIIASHDYVPLGYMACGDGIEGYLAECEGAIEKLQTFSSEHSDLTSREKIDLYNKMNRDLPRVHPGNVESWI